MQQSVRTSWRRGGAWIAALAVLLVASIAPAQEPAARPTEQEIRALLESGDAAAAHERATIAVEYAPDDWALLSLASVAAENASDRDAALRLADRARHCASVAGVSTAKLKPMLARLTELDPIAPEIRSRFDAALAGHFELGQLAAKRKLWANAVELLGRCDGTPYEARAAKELASIYGKKKAVQELLDSGLDVPIAQDSSRPAAWIATNDARHREWEDAWEIKSANYTVVTNIGWELANAISQAMEQMNAFYRTVFRHKERGGGTARCTIYVFKNRDEFLANVPEDQHDAAGFFSSGKNTVHTHDCRPDGEPISELWRTLFHEASHQFTDMIMADMAPIWLDEGTASYFEGAQLQPSGRVQTNLVVDYYLTRLVETIRTGTPSLQSVVSYNRAESYDAEYYPTGWGLVYFLRNYEDDAMERVYAPVYDAYLDAYRTGGKHDKFERFVEYFVTKAKQPGVTTFAEFQARFETWIRELHRRWSGGPEIAPELIELGRRRRAAGRLDAAVDAYRWALSKRPGSLAAAIELGDLLADLGRKDAALATYREVVEVARGGDIERDVSELEDTTAAKVAERARAAMEKLDGLFAERIESVATELGESARAAAAAYVESGCPDNAAYMLATTAYVLASPRDVLVELDRTVNEEGGHWRRRCRLPVTVGLEDWRPIGAWSGENGALSITAATLGLVEYAGDLPESYRFEVSVRPAKLGDAGWLGVAFGMGNDGVWDALGAYVNGTVTVERCSKAFIQLLRLPDIPLEAVKDLQLAVDVNGGVATFWVEGKAVGQLDLGERALRGRVGLACGDGTATFYDPAVLVR